MDEPKIRFAVDLNEILKSLDVDELLRQHRRESFLGKLYERIERDQADRYAESIVAIETHHCHDCGNYFAPAKPAPKFVLLLRCDDCAEAKGEPKFEAPGFRVEYVTRVLAKDPPVSTGRLLPSRQ